MAGSTWRISKGEWALRTAQQRPGDTQHLLELTQGFSSFLSLRFCICYLKSTESASHHRHKADPDK